METDSKSSIVYESSGFRDDSDLSAEIFFFYGDEPSDFLLNSGFVFLFYITEKLIKIEGNCLLILE